MYRITKLMLMSMFIIFSNQCFAKQELKMENNVVVNNCADYIKARENSRVSEDTANTMYDSEYLECSLLDKNFKKYDNQHYEKDLKIIFDKFTVRSIPSSLGPRISRSETLSSLGGKLDIKNAKISLTNEEDNFVLSIKGKIGDKYLVWIIDEILPGTYRSYYPVLLSVDGDKVTASPVYKSGY